MKPQPNIADGKWRFNGRAWEKHLGYPIGHDTPLSPYGRPGGLLYVRESFSYITKAKNERFDKQRPDGCPVEMLYRADAEREGWEREVTWKPSIHMPKWASRLTLRVTAVRVERVQDMNTPSLEAEGFVSEYAGLFRHTDGVLHSENRLRFIQLWDSINAKRGYSWESNPFVWVVEFEKVNEFPEAAPPPEKADIGTAARETYLQWRDETP
jgi:hypothetical protein